MACNNAKYTFLSIGRWCWCCGVGGHCCCYWPIANGRNIKCFLSELKAQQKNDSPWPILRREVRVRVRVDEHWTLKIENFKHGPIFRCLTTHHFPGKLSYERCPPVYIYWALKNAQCEHFHKTKQNKKIMSEENVPNWWNFRWSEASFLLLLFVAVSDFVVPKWGKINRNHVMEVRSIY